MTSGMAGGPELPEFRAFYVNRNRARYGDNFPCPLGTRLDELQVVMAETIADYMTAIRDEMLK